MADLDHPPSRPSLRVATKVVGFVAAINDVRNIVVGDNGVEIFGAAVSGISTQVFAASVGRRFALDHDGGQHRVEPLAIIDVGRGYDE